MELKYFCDKSKKDVDVKYVYFVIDFQAWIS